MAKIAYAPGLPVLEGATWPRTVAFEGIDGTGKSTLAGMLEADLAASGMRVGRYRYYHYDFISDVINRLSAHGYRTAASTAAAFAINFRAAVLDSVREQADIALFDRHKFTALTKDVLMGLPPEVAEDIYEGIPDPDLTFFLRLSPTDALARIGAERSLSWWELSDVFLTGQDYVDAHERYHAGAIGLDEQHASFLAIRSREAERFASLLSGRADVVELDATLPLTELCATVVAAVRGLLATQASTSSRPGFATGAG